jgi:hypothetical protein
MPRAKSHETGVGYGRPPRHAQFKPGQSGNPKGRPKGSISLAAAVAKALTQRVTVTVNGRQKRVTKLDVLTTQLVNRAAAFDIGAVRLLVGLLHLVDQGAQKPAESGAPFNIADEKVLRHLYDRVKNLKSDSPDDT